MNGEKEVLKASANIVVVVCRNVGCHVGVRVKNNKSETTAVTKIVEGSALLLRLKATIFTSFLFFLAMILLLQTPSWKLE